MSMTFPMRIKKKHGKPDLVVQLNPHDIMTQDNIVKLTALIVNTVSNGGLLSLGQNFERAMPAASLKLGGKAMPHVASCFKYGDPPAEAPQVVNRRRLDHDIATDAAHWDQISSEDVTVRDTKWDDRQIRRFCVPVAMRPVNLAGHPGAVIPYLIKGLRATRRTIMYNARFGRDAGTTTDSVHPMGMECGGSEYVLLNTVADRKKSNGEDERCMWVVWDCPLCRSTSRFSLFPCIHMSLISLTNTYRPRLHECEGLPPPLHRHHQHAEHQYIRGGARQAIRQRQGRRRSLGGGPNQERRRTCHRNSHHNGAGGQSEKVQRRGVLYLLSTGEAGPPSLPCLSP